ncbi:MAG: polyprenyl synthetase family protein, partial [Defluviitaleaceae bacterium]|nr:polyprenyl synthetase family protein [Defluviitaleaceae bacterium]
GEIMDVTLPVEPIDIDKDYDGYMAAVYEIYRTKTAWYTLAGPLMMGAIAGGAGEETVNALRDIAIPIGIAFQIKDDLLGMYASDAALGKPAISDLVEKKQTLIYGYAYKHATGVQKAALDRLYGKQDANQADLEAVQDIFTETGAKQFGEDEITTLSQESLALIEKAQISDECKGLLRGLVAYLMARKY